MNHRKRLFAAAITVTMATSLPACVHVTVDPIRVDMNINLRVDKQLDQFFSFENTAPTSQPTTVNTTTAPAA